MMRTVLLLWLLLTLTAAVVYGGKAHGQQQTFCVDSYEKMIAAAQKYNETLRFVGLNKIGHLLYVFAGDQTFTIFVVAPNNQACTMPPLIGDVMGVPQDAAK